MEILETQSPTTLCRSPDDVLPRFDEGVVAMLIEDEGGSVVEANAVARHLVGGERGDVVGRPLAEVLPLRKRGDRAVGGRRRARLLTVDGRGVEVEMMHLPLVIGDQRVGLVCLWEGQECGDGMSPGEDADPEDWRVLASRLADGLVAEVSSLMGFASLLRAGAERGELVIEHVDEIAGASGRLQSMATGLHRFAAPLHGAVEEVDVAALVDSLQGELAEAAGGDDRLSVDLATGLPTANCRVEGLRRVLAGAVEQLAARCGGTEPVVVELSPEPGGAGVFVDLRAMGSADGCDGFERALMGAAARAAGGELSCLDDGGWRIALPAVPGESPELQLEFQMQEPIEPEEPTVVERPDAPASGEVVEPVSREPGAGGADEGSQETAATPAKGRGETKRTVLVVEDEEMVRDLVTRSLGYLGYDVLNACNGEEGLEIARRLRDEIDMVFSDIVMPRMSGPEMVAKMQEEAIDLPVLYTTGFTDNKRLLDNGEIREGVNLLPKPYTTKVLAERVGEILDAISR